MSLSNERIRELLAPYLGNPTLPEVASSTPEPSGDFEESLIVNLRAYLDLLLRWNARTNLTSVRGPEEIIQRHFGESLFLARQLRPFLHPGARILDFGSGAGFPGVPLQLIYPDIQVTLAESRGKKAAFLKETIRTLHLHSQVWAHRVEQLPSDLPFNAVTMRAVDDWQIATAEARRRVADRGILAVLEGAATPPFSDADFTSALRVRVPQSENRFLQLWRRGVPRGTSA